MTSIKILEGIVVSDKADKTIVVAVSSRSKTKFKGKTVKRSERYLVHDPLNGAKEGDMVQITQSKPISRNKRWRLFKIQSKNDSIRPSSENVEKEDLVWFSLKQDW